MNQNETQRAGSARGRSAGSRIAAGSASVPILRTLELLGTSSPCQMMLKRWRRELGHLKVEHSVEIWLQASFASISSEIDSQNRQKAEMLNADTENQVEHTTSLRSQAAGSTTLP
ncbi:hypothetical protein OPT61_g9642 [Boeremia exigua]|uniref:Uncharacterized protein n=1 Tax=Boeremia exigua TaxID=749465 RepID=A0ACC2HT85_9PLEO|nr:hypothetical protein OPT61_g9642 [Boeremia exigua]